MDGGGVVAVVAVVAAVAVAVAVVDNGSDCVEVGRKGCTFHIRKNWIWAWVLCRSLHYPQMCSGCSVLNCHCSGYFQTSCGLGQARGFRGELRGAVEQGKTCVFHKLARSLKGGWGCSHGDTSWDVGVVGVHWFVRVDVVAVV